MGEEEQLNHITNNATNKSNQEIEIEELNLLKFLDSTDNYLILMNQLSSALRQGWFDLASARHSMGASRISSVLFDLKDHNAATSVQANLDDAPHFKLSKWVSANQETGDSKSEGADDELLRGKSGNAQLRQRSMPQKSESVEQSPEKHRSPLVVDDQVQKERLKSLSIFGTLVSPKLRSSQLSFETALDILVETANIRASLLSAYDEMSKGMNEAT